MATMSYWAEQREELKSHVKDRASQGLIDAVDQLLGKLVSLLKDQVSLVLDLDDEIGFLKRVLPKLDEVILNAEVATEEMAELRAVLNNFVEDAEDIVDEFETVVVQSRLSPINADRQRNGCLRRFVVWAGLLMGEERAETLIQLVCGCIPYSSSCFDRSDYKSDSLFFYIKIANQIKGLYGELKRVKKYKERVGSFVDSAIRGLGAVREQRAEVDGLPRRPITDAVRGKDVELVGRERDKEEIMNVLLEGSFKPMVVLVTGMGGIGKTTLVQDIFSAPEVVNHFPIKKWVCVGDELDSKEAMRKIFGTEDREEICEKVRGKRFLIVLDDCWSGQLKRWNELWEPLTHGGAGSKAIITSRQDVGRELGAAFVKPHVLGGLSKEECLRIFESYAFPGGVPSSSSGRDRSTSRLREIGWRIVCEKVGGVPLAARLLGSSLRDVTQVETWKAVLEAVAEDDSMSALMWSYRRLPSHLKRCFSYLSLFPKDTILKKMSVVSMWMACGYVRGDNYSLEHIGKGYFDVLVSSSLLQSGIKKKKNDDDDEDEYFMHDLVHDLASTIHGGGFRNGKDKAKDQEVSTRYPYTRKVRTLFLQTFVGYGKASVEIPDQVKLRYARVLSNEYLRFQKFSRQCLPQIDFNELIHLRYIELHAVEEERVTSLEAICGMYNLQTLVLNVTMTYKFSSRWNLPNLRHLRVLRDSRLTANGLRMEGIGKSKSLRTICSFQVFKDKDIEELENLKELRGELNIRHLNNVRSSKFALKAQLGDKEHVERLILEWDGKYERTVDVMQNEILENLCPHGNLCVLSIKSYRGDRSPNWKGWEHLSELVSLTLSELPHLGDLPPLGHLPRLEELTIENLENLRSIGTTIYGTGKEVFPSLKKLQLKCIKALEEWKEYTLCKDGVTKWFPKLEILSLTRCGELTSLPHLPRQLKSLYLYYTGLRELPEIWSCSNDPDGRDLRYLRELVIRDCPMLCPAKWFRKYRMPSLAKLCLFFIGKCIDLVVNCSVNCLLSFSIKGVPELESVTLNNIVPSEGSWDPSEDPWESYFTEDRDRDRDREIKLEFLRGSIESVTFLNCGDWEKAMAGRRLTITNSTDKPILLLVEDGSKFEPCEFVQLKGLFRIQEGLLRGSTGV